nr:septum formation initiator family protein [Desulfobotulus pelophilus]
MLYALWVAVAAFGARTLLGTDGFVDYNALRQQHQMLLDEKKSLAVRNAELNRRVWRLQEDWVYIEAVARRQLGMVPEHAKVYMFRETRGWEDDSSFFP